MREAYHVRTHPLGGGTQRLYRFENRYGASVVQHPRLYSDGYSTWELAVVVWFGPGADDYGLCYSTPITSDVLGWLTADEVGFYLSEIAGLPALTLAQAEHLGRHGWRRSEIS